MKEMMQLTFVSNMKEEPHFHVETEVYYVISGEIIVKIRDQKNILQCGDIITVNSGIEHEVSCVGDALGVKVDYSRVLIDQIVGYKSGDFNANSTVDSVRDYRKLRNIFRSLIIDELDLSRRDRCRENSLLYELLGELLHHFNVSDTDGEGKSTDDERVQEMLRYINLNFQEAISLNELAEEMYTSISTLSRLFKKQTGVHFAEYVKGIRLRYACQELKYSDSNITKIAIDSGFTNLSGFNRAFRESFGMSPTDYRKEEQERRKQHEIQQNELRDLLRQNKEIQRIEESEELQNTTLTIHAKRDEILPWKKIWNQMINVGSAASLLRANMQYHVSYLAENLGFRYVRIWSIFSENMMITDGIHTNGFNFDQLDSIFDFLDRYHLKPSLDFAPRVTTAVGGKRISGESSIYLKDDNVRFQSREAWQSAVTALLHHLRDRYEVSELKDWIFELGNDVNNDNACYQDEHYNYFDAWSYFYRSVKEIVHGTVGGPGVVLDLSSGWFEQYLETCRREQLIPDYLTIFLFPYHHVNDSNRYENIIDDHFETEEILHLKELMSKYDVKTEISAVEWNPTLSSRSFLNDSLYRGTYFINHVMDIWNQVSMANVWVASDWISSYFDVHGVANGGNGILTRDSICKPAYYALQFLNMLDDTLISYGKNYIVTQGAHGGYHILLTNHKHLSERYYLEKQTVSDPTDLDVIFENDDSLKVKIQLEGVENTRYVVKRRSVGNQEGTLLSEWRRFDYDRELKGNEVAYLRHICFPRMGMKKLEAENQILQIEEELEAHDIVLLHIYKEIRD